MISWATCEGKTPRQSKGKEVEESKSQNPNFNKWPWLDVDFGLGSLGVWGGPGFWILDFGFFS
jgi:hypothetical protein